MSYHDTIFPSTFGRMRLMAQDCTDATDTIDFEEGLSVLVPWDFKFYDSSILPQTSSVIS